MTDDYSKQVYYIYIFFSVTSGVLSLYCVFGFFSAKNLNKKKHRAETHIQNLLYLNVYVFCFFFKIFTSAENTFPPDVRSGRLWTNCSMSH